MTTDLLVDFLNTLDEDNGDDELGDDAAATAWFTAHGLSVDQLDADEARRLRAALRTAADGGVPDSGALACVPFYVVGGEHGLGVTSPHPLWPFVEVALRLSYEGHWDRLKLCDMDTCRYAFYDSSRNRSGRWCSMAVCGNRAKTRSFRERHRG